MLRLRPRHVQNIVILVWTALVVLAFMGLARVVPETFPAWPLWAGGIAVWMTGNIAILVRATRQWRSMSDDLGLRPAKPVESTVEWLGLPDLVGQHGGREVSVQTFASGGHGTTRRTEWTIIGATVRAPAGPLEVRSSSWRAAGAPAPGSSRVTTGDDAFDAAFEVFARDPALATKVLTGPVRARLSALDEPQRIVLDGDRVEQRVRARLLDPQRMRRHLDAVVILADEVERAVG